MVPLIYIAVKALDYRRQGCWFKPGLLHLWEFEAVEFLLLSQTLVLLILGLCSVRVGFPTSHLIVLITITVLEVTLAVN